MLTAARGNKLRHSDLYEDEITSCVFGTLQYLPVNEVWAIFRELIEASGLEVPLGLPCEVSFDFWHRWETYNSRHVEPDLVVTFWHNCQKEILVKIILEIKWNATLNPKCELIRQWGFRDSKEELWMHLYLTKDGARGKYELKESQDLSSIRGPGCTVISTCNNYCGKKILDFARLVGNQEDFISWKNFSGHIGWRDVVAVANKATVNNIWKSEVSAFFERLGVVPFSGFDWLDGSSLEFDSQGMSPFFMKESWFDFLDHVEFPDNSFDFNFAKIN